MFGVPRLGAAVLHGLFISLSIFFYVRVSSSLLFRERWVLIRVPLSDIRHVNLLFSSLLPLFSASRAVASSSIPIYEAAEGRIRNDPRCHQLSSLKSRDFLLNSSSCGLDWRFGFWWPNGGGGRRPGLDWSVVEDLGSACCDCLEESLYFVEVIKGFRVRLLHLLSFLVYERDRE